MCLVEYCDYLVANNKLYNLEELKNLFNYCNKNNKFNFICFLIKILV